jgi:hypothetical protein
MMHSFKLPPTGQAALQQDKLPRWEQGSRLRGCAGPVRLGVSRGKVPAVGSRESVPVTAVSITVSVRAFGVPYEDLPVTTIYWYHSGIPVLLPREGGSRGPTVEQPRGGEKALRCAAGGGHGRRGCRCNTPVANSEGPNSEPPGTDCHTPLCISILKNRSTKCLRR